MTAVSDRTAWMDRGVCLQVGHDPFFDEGKGKPEPMAAKALCRSCESRLPCLEWALENRIRDGVFGGFTDRPRRVALRQHRAGKSFEDIIAEDDEAFYARIEKRAAA